MGKHKFITKSENNSNKSFKRKDKQFKPRNHKGEKKWINTQNFKVAEEPTPWLKLKEAFMEQEKIMKNEKKSHNSKEENAFMQEKAKKYKEFLIKEKQKQETVWEDFNLEDDNAASASDKIETCTTSETDQSEKYDKKTSKNLDHGFHKGDVNEMSGNAKNFFRKVITSTTSQARGLSFYEAMQDLKHKAAKKQKENKSTR